MALGDRAVAHRAQADVALQADHPRTPGALDLVEDRDRLAVVGGVVHDDHLRGGQCLRADGLQRGGQVAAVAVAGDHHRDLARRRVGARERERLGGGAQRRRHAPAAAALDEALPQLLVPAGESLEPEVAAHALAGACGRALAGGGRGSQHGGERLGVRVSPRRDRHERARVVVHQLDVARQRRRDDRDTHRQRLEDHVGDALEGRRHQHGVGGPVPARDLLGRRVPGDPLRDPVLLGPAPGRHLELALADHVQCEVHPASGERGGGVDRRLGILLGDQAPRPEDLVPGPEESVQRRDGLRIELALGVHAGVDDLDPAVGHVVAAQGLSQVARGHREAVHELGVALRRIGDVAATVGLGGVQLHDRGGRVRERGDIGQQVEAQPRVHVVHHVDRATVDEPEHELGEVATGHQVRQHPQLLRVGLDLIQPAVGRGLGADQRRREAVAVEVAEQVDDALVRAAQIHPGSEVEHADALGHLRRIITVRVIFRRLPAASIARTWMR